MKKLIFFLLCIPFISFSQEGLGEYYKSNNHPKSKGLNFQIKKPLGFEQMEADRPNIVQKWMKDRYDNNKLVMFMVQVRYLPKEIQSVSKKEWTQYFKYETGVSDIIEEMNSMDNSFANNGKYFNLDNHPGVYYEGYMDMDRLDVRYRLYHKTIQVFVDNYIFLLQINSPVKSVLESNNFLFRNLANSVIFTDQYGF